MKFNITFSITTEESAAHGDFDATGFEMQDVPLRDAYNFLLWHGGYCEASCSDTSAARWLTFYGERDFRTGEMKDYGLHFPEKLTSASRKRIARLFKCVQ
jgi:hypothetical protein